MTKKKDKIQEIIDKSGYDLQFQVAEYLEGHKWEVSISPHYNDPATGKPREIDIIAIRRWPMRNDFESRELGELLIRLFIECKYIKDSAVLWFRQKNMTSAMELAKDNSILDSKPDYYLVQNQTPAQHHYVDDVQVAKIAAKSGKRDDIFEAINQCLNGLIFFGNSPNPYCIDYPIIITNSFQNLHRRDSDTGHAPIIEPFQFEVDYSFKQSRSDGKSIDITKYFLIDIMGFDKLDSFLQDLESRDIKLFRENLHWDLEYQERQYREQSEEDPLSPF